ncbi:MAG: tetratricopeptide repeat protein [Candidatus Omnitrophica bacterium]|nr:tetratricopeptide repeat protein [Candidatus Omnitrophota bacterium]
MKKVVIVSVFVAFLAVAGGFARAEEAAIPVVPSGAAPVVVPAAQAKAAYNFGDHRSSTLTTKAWGALAMKDLDGVLAYTGKCLELYAAEAAKMQAGLKEFPAGDDQKIFSFWALNDVATSVYIQGEAYNRAGDKEKAKAAFERVTKEFSFGQAWDPSKKLFWKPSVAAKDKLDMMAKGIDLDFSDMSSAGIVKKAWEASAAKNVAAVEAYVAKNLELYGAKAKEMQAGLTEYPWESPEKIHSFWALNDIGTSLFVLGDTYRQAGQNGKAKETFQKLVNEYFYAQCWDPQGWFWKPAEAAQQKLVELEAAK